MAGSGEQRVWEGSPGTKWPTPLNSRHSTTGYSFADRRIMRTGGTIRQCKAAAPAPPPRPPAGGKTSRGATHPQQPALPSQTRCRRTWPHQRQVPPKAKRPSAALKKSRLTTSCPFFACRVCIAASAARLPRPARTLARVPRAPCASTVSPGLNGPVPCHELLHWPPFPQSPQHHLRLESRREPPPLCNLRHSRSPVGVHLNALSENLESPQKPPRICRTQYSGTVVQLLRSLVQRGSGSHPEHAV